MLVEYGYIFVLVLISLALSLVVFFLSYLLVQRERDLEKSSAYECGFQPFEDTRERFDVKFYLVAILFLIFDLEITFLFPWAVQVYVVGVFGFYAMIFFLFVLTVGFFYEWFKGALEW